MLATGLGRILDRLDRLPLGPYEDDFAVLGDQVADPFHRHEDGFGRDLQIDDVLALLLREDVGGHLGVPAVGGVPEVGTCFKQVQHHRLEFAAVDSLSLRHPVAPVFGLCDRHFQPGTTSRRTPLFRSGTVIFARAAVRRQRRVGSLAQAVGRAGIARRRTRGTAGGRDLTVASPRPIIRPFGPVGHETGQTRRGVAQPGSALQWG